MPKRLTEEQMNHLNIALGEAIFTNNNNAAKKALEQGAAVDSPDNDGRTALMYAAASMEPAIIDALMKYGADIDATDNNGKTALMYAAQNNKIDNLNILMLHRIIR